MSPSIVRVERRLARTRRRLLLADRRLQRHYAANADRSVTTKQRTRISSPAEAVTILE